MDRYSCKNGVILLVKCIWFIRELADVYVYIYDKHELKRSGV